MDPCKTMEIGALRRLLEECRSKATDLQIADVAYILLMAETSIAEHLGHLQNEQQKDCPSSVAGSPKGVLQ